MSSSESGSEKLKKRNRGSVGSPDTVVIEDYLDAGRLNTAKLNRFLPDNSVAPQVGVRSERSGPNSLIYSDDNSV